MDTFFPKKPIFYVPKWKETRIQWSKRWWWEQNRNNYKWKVYWKCWCLILCLPRVSDITFFQTRVRLLCSLAVTEPYAVFPAPEADNLLKFLGLFGPTILEASLQARDRNLRALSCVILSLALLGSEWAVYRCWESRKKCFSLKFPRHLISWEQVFMV